MAVHFDLERMEQVRENHMKWWRGELGRPLAKIIIEDMYEAEELEIPVISQANCLDFSWTPEQVIEALDNHLSRQEYLGDAFPTVDFCFFGPGIVAAFCSARMDNSTGNMWLFPQEELEIEDIHVKYDPNNPIVQRIKAIYRAGLEKWKGTVIMTMPDLGGVMDIAAVFRGSENLLMDLYESPEEVKRLNEEIQTAWYEAFWDFAEVLKPQNAYSHFSGLLSTTPSYIVQSDFTYMIGNPMFKEFVLDTIRTDTERLDNVIFHLDGIGELRHLDDLLGLEKLKAIQWVFGDGQPQADSWMDVHHKIVNAGKGLMVCGDPESNLKVLPQLSGKQVYISNTLKKDQMELAQKLISVR